MKLSILTPAIWSRISAAGQLKNKIETQVNDWLLKHPAASSPVEHLVLLDTRTRSVGLKRQGVLDAALGDYIAFVDDDDDIAPDYVEKLLTAIEHEPDVITFEQRAIVNDEEGTCVFGINNRDEPFIPGTRFNRAPWHVCVWRRDLIKDCVFPDHSYGEDLTWSLQARRRVRTSLHIDKVLHTYRHHRDHTAAPPLTSA